MPENAMHAAREAYMSKHGHGEKLFRCICADCKEKENAFEAGWTANPDSLKLNTLLVEMRRAIDQFEDKAIKNSDGETWPTLPKGIEHVIAFHRASSAAFLVRRLLEFAEVQS